MACQTPSTSMAHQTPRSPFDYKKGTRYESIAEPRMAEGWDVEIPADDDFETGDKDRKSVV